MEIWLIKVEEKDGRFKFYEKNIKRKKWKAWSAQDFNQFKKWINSLEPSIFSHEFERKREKLKEVA